MEFGHTELEPEIERFVVSLRRRVELVGQHLDELFGGGRERDRFECLGKLVDGGCGVRRG